ncbi:MAG: hypothetical protein HC771_01270 [Synechococcales cyanobacterium CRU_2_2]|nr:hypothetical protein [Synechococcales cyanobacterium CRU_2_2]
MFNIAPSKTPGSVTSSSPRDQVQSLLLMRYSMMPLQSNQLCEAWLARNSDESWASLKQFLHMGQILVKQQSLLDLRQFPLAELLALVEALRGESGLPIRDRKHRLKIYRRCFTGTELVAWLQHHRGAIIPEAIRLGELMVENHLMHHVLDEHGFENELLFYRFYADEIF